MKHSLVISCAILVMLLLSHPINSSAEFDDEIGFRVELTRVNAARDLTSAERVRRAAQRSKSLRRVNPNGFMTSFPSSGEYAIDLEIGTPPQPMRSIIDTGSDLIWTQCANCAPCQPQPLPLFDPSRSSTFSALACSNKFCKGLDSKTCAANKTCYFSFQYGDGSFTEGQMSTEALTFGSVKKLRIPNLAFGCGLANAGTLTNTTGIMGFARGPLSLVSQLRIGRFSFCFTDAFKHARTPMFFGSQARLSGADVQTTPLITHPPPALPSLYFITIKGITIGKRTLPAPPVEFDRAGNGGTIIDSGSDISVFHHTTYLQMIDTFRSQAKLPYVNGSGEVGLEICFESATGKEVLPRFVYHFDGAADLDMPRGNYVRFDDGSGLLCVQALDGGGITIVGNINMQNIHVLYDLKKNQLSFQPAKCDEL